MKYGVLRMEVAKVHGNCTETVYAKRPEEFVAFLNLRRLQLRSRLMVWSRVGPAKASKYLPKSNRKHGDELQSVQSQSEMAKMMSFEFSCEQREPKCIPGVLFWVSKPWATSRFPSHTWNGDFWTLSDTMVDVQKSRHIVFARKLCTHQGTRNRSKLVTSIVVRRLKRGSFLEDPNRSRNRRKLNIRVSMSGYTRI